MSDNVENNLSNLYDVDFQQEFSESKIGRDSSSDTPLADRIGFWQTLKKIHIGWGLVVHTIICEAESGMKIVFGKESTDVSVITFGGIAFTWAFIIYLRVIINARIAGKDWWLQPNILRLNDKLITAFIFFQGVMTWFLLKGFVHNHNMHWGVITFGVIQLLIVLCVVVITGFLTHGITHEDP